MPPFVSHAQHGEDVRLRRLFADQPPGFFVDVGAADPVGHSVTHWLSEQGWHGVNVEPTPYFHSLLAARRPRDVNLRCVLGREPSPAKRFYEAPLQRGSSTSRPEFVEDLRNAGFELIAHDVPVSTLAEVMEAHAPAEVALLKLDVEGAEADVLAGNDWERFRPRVVVVERTRPEEWEADLLAQGYVLAVDDGLNSWYVEQESRAWAEVLARAVPTPPSGPRLSVLLVLSSLNQLYSGAGRVLFETLGPLMETILDVELVIDEHDERNVGLARAFADRHGCVVHVGRAEWTPGCPDMGNGDLATVVASRPWDLVYAVSWANSATNGRLLEVIGDRALAFLPMHQPVSSIPPLPFDGATRLVATEAAMLRRADVVLCISPYELHAVTRFVAPDSPRAAVIRPGADFASFTPGPAERPADLLFVGDHREPRKRFDRVVAVLERLHADGHPARLVVIGNESHQAAAAVPAALRDAVVSLGYVDEARLRQAYHDAAVLLLLSEHEAFGLPVIEALASGTAVVMAEQPAPRSLFAHLDGMHFVDADDTAAVAGTVAVLLAEGPALHARLAGRHEVLALEFGNDVAAEATRRHLLAAWARRHRHTPTTAAA